MYMLLDPVIAGPENSLEIAITEKENDKETNTGTKIIESRIHGSCLIFGFLIFFYHEPWIILTFSF